MCHSRELIRLFVFVAVLLFLASAKIFAEPPVGSVPIKGLYYLNKGMYDEAIADLTSAIQLDPGNAEHYCNRANAYAKKGNYEQAILDYSKASEIRPNYIEAYFGRATVYKNKGSREQSVTDYTRVILIDPDYYPAAEKEDNIDYKYFFHREDSKIQDTPAKEANPELAEAYYNQGNAAANKDEFDEAIFHYTKAIHYNPKYAKAYNERAFVYFQKGEYNTSWENIRKAEDLGLRVDKKFLEDLKKVSGRLR